MDDNLPAPLPPGSIPPPPPPRAVSPTGLEPKASIAVRGGPANLTSPTDEMGRMEDDGPDEADGAADEEEGEREDLANERYGAVSDDPYASLGAAFGGGGGGGSSNYHSNSKDDDLIGF